MGLSRMLSQQTQEANQRERERQIRVEPCQRWHARPKRGNRTRQRLQSCRGVGEGMATRVMTEDGLLYPQMDAEERQNVGLRAEEEWCRSNEGLGVEDMEPQANRGAGGEGDCVLGVKSREERVQPLRREKD